MPVDYTEAGEKFFSRQRDPDDLAKLFAIFRVGERSVPPVRLRLP